MLLTREEIETARRNLLGVALRTPLTKLQASAPADVYLKLENLQPIGSFKLRGAANVMARLPSGRLACGVLTASAGNMAQGVAYCARARGIPATIIAPDTAPIAKIAAVERLGGRVIQIPFADWWRCFETRSYPGVEGEFIHAFDDLDVMAGNATIGLELIEDLPDLDAVVVPWGGGGLACGIAAALRLIAPQVKVFAVEAETATPLAAALAAGEPREVSYQSSFVDGIGSRKVFPRMLERAQGLLVGSLVVSLREAADAMTLAAERNRVVLEGAAACAVAAAIAGRAGTGKVAAIASGGNIDLSKFATLIT